MDKRFSTRYGHVEVSQLVQLEGLNNDTRVAIWNAIFLELYSSIPYVTDEAENCAAEFWVSYLNKPADSMPNLKARNQYERGIIDYFKDYIYSKEWYFVFDLVQFIIAEVNVIHGGSLSKRLNETFRRYWVAYSIINGLITPISNSQEIESIETAVNMSTDSSSRHFSRALELMVDREQPDYRNSIKESISAIESLCKKITGNDKATLGECLKIVEGKGYIHPAMKQAFSQLYGYTSDQSGVRHSLKDGEREPTLEDARFMLISCSAFNNYLLSKIQD
ncbi:hypothetical protein GJV14_03550 [Enterobacteriaceae bacterium RIT697]|nr:hypothetical protein [Enterobacteriaceae bacterium RIT697]